MNLGHVCDETWYIFRSHSPLNFGLLPSCPLFLFILTHWIQLILLLLGKLFWFYLCCCDKNIWTKTTEKARDLFQFTVSDWFQTIVLEKSRPGLQTSHPRTREQWMWACSLANLCSFGCLHSFRILCLGNGATPSGLDLPKSIKLIKIIPHKHGQPKVDSPSLRLSS